MTPFTINLFVFIIIISLGVNGAPRSSKTISGLNGNLGRSPTGINVVGGDEATIGEFPWIVGIRRPNHLCGGTILNSQWIITAAHCSQGEISKYLIVAGDHINNEDEGREQIRSIVRIINHPLYSALTNENDLALMQVSPPFELNEFVSPVQLVKQSFVPSGEPMTVAGWGQLLEDGQLSNTLMKVDVPFVPQETCSALYGGTRIKDTMLCGGEGGKDACKGDSGGPLMCPDGDNYSLCGVVSFGTGCARPDKPGVYTKVWMYYDWIQSSFQSVEKS